MTCPRCSALEERVASIEARLAGLAPCEARLLADQPVAAIVADCAALLGLEVDAILSGRRHDRLALARAAISWAAARATTHSNARLAAIVGGRHPSTVTHQVARAEQLRDTDAPFELLTNRLLAAALEREACRLIRRPA